MRSVGVGRQGSAFFNFAHESAHVLAGVPGQLDDLCLPHPLLHGVGHGLGQGVQGVVVALLGRVLGAHGLTQYGDGLFGGGHTCMFAHRGGHTKARTLRVFKILACGHIDVASLGRGMSTRSAQFTAPFGAFTPATTHPNGTLMAKRMDVGTSEQHTPIKHAIMREFVGKEVRAANSLGWIKRLVWIDLTAGNAEAAHGDSWADSCSPGILASRATKSIQPVVIDLYEKNPDTYTKLVNNLDEYLPTLGYRRAHDNGWSEWATANVHLRAWDRDGREAGISHIRRGDAVLVLNDPNSITEWAMRRTFASEINSIRGVKGIRALSCVGFNVSGIKRTPFLRDDPEPQPDSVKARSDWYGLIGSITDTLPDRLDLMLAGFARDRSQWAYLFSSPTVWRDKGEEEAVIAEAFTVTGEPHDYEYAWAKRDREKFIRLVDRRILTKSELAERESQQLPFESGGDESAA